MIDLGKKARDKITRIEGIVTGRADYIYGCTQYCIVPEVKADGKRPDSEWFDEGRLEVIGPGILPEEVQVKDPGGPQRDAPAARR